MDDVDEYTHIDIPNGELGIGSDKDGCFTAKQALDVMDAKWYNKTSQLGRWMDIVGDYAGEELILLDGDSLLGVVLDDPLLALGRQNDNSFQFLHARYSLERALLAYRKRGAVFEVVFFEDQRHVTYCTGEAEFVSASRILARTFLKRSLRELQIPMHTFQNLSDNEWDEFYIKRKPMLVVTDDGGSVEEDNNLKAARALILRAFIFDILSKGISVALMRGAEFNNAKIFSFVYEQRPILDARSTLDQRVWKALSHANASLDARTSTKLNAAPAYDRADWLRRSTRALSETGPNDALLQPLLYIFIVHATALDSIPIQLRTQALPELPSALEAYLRNSFLLQLFLCMESSMPASPTFHDIDLDGRIFLRLLQIFGSSSSVECNIVDLLGPDAAMKFTDLWKTLDIAVDFCTLSSYFHGFTPRECTAPVRGVTPLSVLPFSHPVFDHHLKPVYVDVDGSSFPDIERGYFEFGSGFGTLFEDKMHWHNSRKSILPKHLGGDDKPAALDDKARKKALKRDQNFHAGLQRQAQSLTGALGKPLERIVIAHVGTKSLPTKPTKHPQVSNPSKNSKKGSSQKLTSVERARLQIQDQKQTKKDSEDSSWWTKTLLDIESLPSIEARIQKTELLLRNPRTAGGWLAAEIRLYRLHLEIHAWINHPKTDDAAAPKTEDTSITDKFRVSILKMTQDPKLCESPASAGILASVLTALGFKDLVPALPVTESKKASDRKLSFEFIKVIKKSGNLVHKFMRLEEPPTNWMLRCFGDHMDRSLNSAPDKRVPFEPDWWQRKVLDSLDEDDSVLVVAPTSADDGILVYVAPTKALVTQIAAEVSARYSKDIDGRSCWAVHTRDYRIHDPQKCQILITVPEVLAIMLLSPTLARVWTPRLRRIILDEIHSIGQEGSGSVWEQILLLTPCPIIGLSATIGEPQQFNDWLSSVQSAHHFKHTFIEHPHRYSHLRKFFYLHPKDPRGFDGLSKHKRTERLRFMHPVCMLASGMARGVPPDFSLEARDCLSLYHALKEEAHAIEPGKLNDIDPESHFPRDRLIKQEDVLRYETKLKMMLDELITSPRSHEASSTLQSVVRRLSDPVLAGIPEHVLAIPPERKVMEDDFINVMSDLHIQGDLPALIFSFDRHQCERLAQRLLTSLQEAEEGWRATSVEWRNKLEAWDRYQAKAKERERLKERFRRQRPDEDQAGGLRQSPKDDMSWEASFDPSDPSHDFSFAGFKTSFDKASLEEELRSLGWTSTPKWALQAIKRGIAVHHSGMNRKYRNLVESLFRVGFLRVVIATGTLALGINAPCRTVVFFGDSTYLTALQFRQAAGRAGRRGFDLLGKVVFYGLPLERVQRLVLSRLPSISGHFPLSTTLSLRLFNLLAGSQNSPYASKVISAILSLPQISIGSETAKHEVLHHLRFSIDYLLRARLLAADGQPLNLTGIAAHLFYHEPYNLAFVALLRSGVIHKICNQASKVAAIHELMLVLCHLFGRRRVPRAANNEDILRPILKRYPSMIVLPPLPQAVREVLSDHAIVTLRVFSGYACTYASQHATQLGPDDMLPLSGIRVTPSLVANARLSQILFASSLRPMARSAFVATSGHGDVFESVHELCHDARQGLHLNENAIPSMDAILANHKSPFKLNAYLLDFYMHGQVNTLVVANGIRRGDVWFLLQDFDLTLKTIRASIQELLLKASRQHTTVEDEDGVGNGTLGFQDVLDADEGTENTDDFPRPPGVNDADWKVYEVLSTLTKDFSAKFRAMWA